MLPLTDRIQAANKLLTPYAVPHEGVLGRVHEEPGDERRFPFQRDRDRIVHTQAFRRLQGKTQVFVPGEGDHFRTRLTHTVEVVQVGRDIARALGLNEDLVECIALAHDLGHPPFGHSGEEALNVWMRGHGKHFEHNEQSHRLVTVIEEHSPQFPGVNLQREILEGLRKHERDGGHTLEAQVVNLADEIAYTAHDCEDGLRAGLFSMEEIADIPLIADANALRSDRGTSLRGAIIRFLIEDLLQETTARLASEKIHTLDDVRAHREPLVHFSARTHEALNQWRDFLWPHMYLHPRVIAPVQEGQQLLLSLCQHFLRSPIEKITALERRTGSDLPTAIVDYTAGMTDAFARAQGRELGIHVPRELEAASQG